MPTPPRSRKPSHRTAPRTPPAHAPLPAPIHDRPRRSAYKPLDQMDRLADMLHFPALVNAGATVNVLLTIIVTWLLVPRVPQLAPAIPPAVAPLLWTALVLTLNLTPVVLLRARDRVASAHPAHGNRPMPRLRDMNFVHDQHRFSDWVYLAASANMAFWVLVSWSTFSLTGSVRALATLLGIAFLVTFSPVLLRVFTHQAD